MLNPKLILSLAHCSNRTYSGDDNLTRFGFTVVEEFGVHRDVSGCLIEGPDFDVLAFKGTVLTEWETVKEDLKAWRARDNGTAYDFGFLEAFHELQPLFMPLLAERNRPFYITGHSLGGAIAGVTARHMLDANDGYFQAAYTFGQPRFSYFFETNRIFRFVHENDIVPALPWPIGYRHVGDLCYITADNRLLTGRQAHIARALAMAFPITQGTTRGALALLRSDLIPLVVTRNPLPVLVHAIMALTSSVKNHLLEHYLTFAEQFAANGEKN